MDLPWTVKVTIKTGPSSGRSLTAASSGAKPQASLELIEPAALRAAPVLDAAHCGGIGG